MKKLLLIDAHALIHRMFHALPDFTNERGEPTGALYGVSNALLKILKRENPDYVAAAFDLPEPTFRKKMFPEYKAHRKKIDEPLLQQLEKSRELFAAFGVPVVEAPGYEADDVIGTLAQKFGGKTKVEIFTGDLDALQLVKDEDISVITFKKGISETIRYDEVAVTERFGVGPEKLVDWKALVGDKSDNIPGVPGIGAKGAEKLILKYGSLKGILSAKDDDRIVKKVQENREIALLSQDLSRIRTDAPVKITLEDLKRTELQKTVLAETFKDLGFESLIAREGLGERAKKPSDADLALKTDESIMAFGGFEDAKKIRKGDGSGKIKAAYDWKGIWKECAEDGFEIPIDGTYFDVMIAAWLLAPDKKEYSWESVSESVFGESREKTRENIAAACEFLLGKISDAGLRKIMSEFEMPLIPVLGDTERRGISVNAKKLASLETAISEETETLKKEIFSLSGEEFNLNSPQQISALLFGKLGLGGKKKTKTGLSSTKEGVLEELAQKHPIVPLILAYRENSKISGTYVTPLLALAKEGKGLIHTTFVQIGTATGRLSSEKPNLQNIPQESKWSKPLREAFEARKGTSFLSLDYSQLELRIIAHVSKDAGLLSAFSKGRDIHQATAEKIFHKSDISPTERRVAKTLNFGLAYGMGARSFAKSAGVSFDDAKRYVEEYFREFPGVKKWQEEEKERAKKFGYVENETGRRRWFDKSRNFFEIERAAINMPIQSLEADIMKRALIESFQLIRDEKISARIALTVHDELILEVSDDILESFSERIARLMENCLRISVPLVVDAKVGKNLGNLKKI